MWADASLQMAPATSGLSVVEFDAGGFFAPIIERAVIDDLSSMSVDV
jgi:hypothetical protein